MAQAEISLIEGSLRQDIDDAVILLQYAISNDVPVLPIVVEEILKAAAEAYPHAFDLDPGDIDANNADDIAQFVSRLNAEHQSQEVPNVSGLEPRGLEGASVAGTPVTPVEPTDEVASTISTVSPVSPAAPPIIPTVTPTPPVIPPVAPAAAPVAQEAPLAAPPPATEVEK